MRLTSKISTRDVPNFESVLITRILETGDLKTAVKRKITADFFFLPETRTAYSFLIKHFQMFGEVPSIELFRKEFRNFNLRTTSDTVDAICNEMHRAKLYADQAEILDEMNRLNREDPHEALQYLRQQVASLTSAHTVTNDSDLTREIEEAKAEYLRVKAGAGIIGVPWPWPKLNDTTLGVQKQELVFFYARPKSLKTWLLGMSAVHAFKLGRKPLFISKEMPSNQIRRRMHAIFAGVDYEALRSGKLTQKEEKDYFENLEAFSENPPFILSGDDEDKGGVMSVIAKVKEYDPDVVYIDGVYLMHDDRSNKRSSDLKRAAKQLNIPIIGSTQANRSAEKTKGESKSEMAFGDSFIQDADYVIRIIHDKVHREDEEAIITLPAIREAPGCTFTIHAKVADDLTQKYVAETQEDEDEILAGTDEGVVR
jgi:replicative DNA helicase